MQVDSTILYPSHLPYHIPYSNPHSSVQMEMPKYTQELSKQGLRLFIKRFELWAATKRMDEQAAKLAFPLAFNNLTAQEYFIIHDADLMNPHMNWNYFIQKFLRNCPMEVSDTTSIFKILGKRQQPDEQASIYVQKIRYLIGTDFAKYNEQEIISLMMEGLHSDIRHYLECRGTPLTYADLVSKIQVYEERGLPRYAGIPVSNPTFTPTISVAPAPPVMQVPMNYTHAATTTTDLEAAVRALLDHFKTNQRAPTAPPVDRQGNSNQTGGPPGPNPSRRTQKFCTFCQRTGHEYANCYTRLDMERPGVVSLKEVGAEPRRQSAPRSPRSERRDPYHYGNPPPAPRPGTPPRNIPEWRRNQTVSQGN
jgi:hypothetical protein